ADAARSDQCNRHVGRAHRRTRDRGGRQPAPPGTEVLAACRRRRLLALPGRATLGAALHLGAARRGRPRHLWAGLRDCPPGGGRLAPPGGGGAPVSRAADPPGRFTCGRSRRDARRPECAYNRRRGLPEGTVGGERALPPLGDDAHVGGHARQERERARRPLPLPTCQDASSGDPTTAWMTSVAVTMPTTRSASTTGRAPTT